MVVVGIGFFVWSRFEVDPGCTDGPCADEVLLLLGLMAEAALAFLWVVTAVVVSVVESRREGSR
jgi:hypothetical protein